MYLLPCRRHKPQIGSGWSVDCSPLQMKHIELLHNFTWGHFIKGGAFWLTFSQPHCFEYPPDSFHGGSTVPWFCTLTLLCLMRRSEKSSSQDKLCKQSWWIHFLKEASQNTGKLLKWIQVPWYACKVQYMGLYLVVYLNIKGRWDTEVKSVFVFLAKGRGCGQTFACNFESQTDFSWSVCCLRPPC